MASRIEQLENEVAQLRQTITALLAAGDQVVERGQKIFDGGRLIASPDFSVVTWLGGRFIFRGAQQRECIRLLWPSLRDAFGLESQQVAARLGVSEHFRLPKLFRGHPAWG